MIVVFTFFFLRERGAVFHFCTSKIPLMQSMEPIKLRLPSKLRLKRQSGPGLRAGGPIFPGPNISFAGKRGQGQQLARLRHGLLFTGALLPAFWNLPTPSRRAARGRRVRECRGVFAAPARRRGDARAGEERRAHRRAGESPSGYFSRCALVLKSVVRQ